MEVKSKEYEIYAGIGSTDDDVEFIDRIVLDSDIEARDYAEMCAFGLYNFNPKRDIFEIMNEENVSEEEALEIFKREAMESVVFFALEYEIDSNGRKVMVRHY